MSHSVVEIERKFLLHGLPPIPAAAEAIEIEQGYLDPPEAPDFPAAGEPVREGRIRRSTLPGGGVICHHTLKSGRGIRRHEREREIPAGEFERAWPFTEGQRIEKTRHLVRTGEGLIWEIDEIRFPVRLVLAEVELPDAEHPLEIPQWLAPFIEKEVTDDPAYNNRAIARRGTPGRDTS